MTTRIARVRPRNATPGTQYFVQDAGSGWRVIESPFPGSPANAASAPAEAWQPGAAVTEDGFDFLAPVQPANVLGMAHNTGAAGRALPPQAFHKAATSVIGPGEPIPLAAGVGHVDPEAELTIVIGSTARGLTLANARGAILGFTIGNDVTARELQASDELWISAKSQDGFTPLGPWIVTDLDDEDRSIQIVHNDQELTAASTSDLGWNVAEILVYLTSFMTLHPGDIVLTGFPAESRRLAPGDVVDCRIDGIGTLSNPVTEANPLSRP